MIYIIYMYRENNNPHQHSVQTLLLFRRTEMFAAPQKKKDLRYSVDPLSVDPIQHRGVTGVYLEK